MLGLTGTISRSLIRRLTVPKEEHSSCKYKLFERRCSTSVNSDTKTTSSSQAKPKFKSTQSRNYKLEPAQKLNEELERFKKSIEQNKPISAAWCTGLISQATELKDWKVATFVYRKTKLINVPMDKALFTAILHMYIKQGSEWMKALTFIDKSPDNIENLDAKSFHGLINVIRSYNRFDLGMQVFEAMKKKHVVIDAFAANVLLGMALKRKDKASAKKIIEEYKQNGANEGPLENELVSSFNNCNDSLDYLMLYLAETAPKESKVIILLNHLIENYFKDLENREIKQIYNAVSNHKGLTIQQGLLTVMSKMLGRAAYYHLILDTYLAAVQRGVTFDRQFYIETISQFVIGQKDEYTDKFIDLMKSHSKIQDTLEFYSKLFIKVNFDPPAVFSLLKRVHNRYPVVDPQFALLFILFLTKSSHHFEVLALDPELVKQVLSWKELIDVNYDTAATMLEMQPNKFWALVNRCRGMFERAQIPNDTLGNDAH